MAIEVKTDIDSMNAAELETALGVPGAATRWDSFGPLMTLHRISLFPTVAWGIGDGTANRHPGWLATWNHAKVVIETDPMIAGCKCILLKIRAQVK